MRLGLNEIIVLAIIVVLLFGSALIPKMFASLRKSGHVLKEEVEKTQKEFKSEESE